MSRVIESKKFPCHHLARSHYLSVDLRKPVVVFVNESIAADVEKDASNIPDGTMGRCLAPSRGLCDHLCGDVRIVIRADSLQISPIQSVEPRR